MLRVEEELRAAAVRARPCWPSRSCRPRSIARRRARPGCCRPSRFTFDPSGSANSVLPGGPPVPAMGDCGFAEFGHPRHMKRGITRWNDEAVVEADVAPILEIGTRRTFGQIRVPQTDVLSRVKQMDVARP